MSGCVRREGQADLLPIRGRIAEAVVRCVVRMTMLLSTLISVEPWKRTRHRTRPQVRKSQDWSVSFRNLFG